MVGRGDGQAEARVCLVYPSPGAQARLPAVENLIVGTAAQRQPRTQRPPLGADVPCRQCGEPIYYNYRGPVEGVCGKCSDGLKRVSRTPSRRLAPVERPRGVHAAWLGAVAVFAFAAGAFAGYLAHTFLPF